MLLKKMIRTIKIYLVQFIAMFIMVFLGVFVYVGINSEWYGMQVSSEEFYEETNIADFWIMSDNFTTEEILKIKENEDIDNVERRLSINATVTNTEKTLTMNFVEKNEISSLYLVEGEDFNIEKDGIWLFDRFALSNNYKIGDVLSFTYGNIVIEEKVRGLIKHPEYIYAVEDENVLIPNFFQYGFGVLSYKQIPLPYPVYNTLLIKSSLTKGEIRENIDKMLPDKFYILQSQDENISVKMFDEEIKGNKVMAQIFPVVFLLIAVLTMITTMTRITTNEKNQIGILKALGFSEKRIIVHYTSYGLIVGTVASILGIIFGPLILGEIFLGFQSTMYDLPLWEAVVSIENYFVVIMMVIILVFICFLSCRKALQGTASELLRTVMPYKPKKNVLEKMPMWKNFSFNTKWNIRDIFRNPLRSVMTIIGVSGSVMLLICAFSMNDSMKYINVWMYDEINIYENRIDLSSDSTLEEVNKLLLEVDGEGSMTTYTEISSDVDMLSYSLNVFEGEKLVKFQNQNKQEITLNDDGIYISYKVAKTLGVKKGDTIQWCIYGSKTKYESQLIDIIRVPMGQGMIMSKGYANSIGLPYKVNVIYTAKETIDLEYTFIQSIQSKTELVNTINTMLNTMQEIVYIMVIGAIILGVVVLYNLGVLSYTERFRELSTLKVLGFADEKINKLLISQNIWLTIIGIIIGIPLGNYLLNVTMSSLSDSVDFYPVTKFVSYLICILGALAISTITNLFLFRKTRKIDMVSSLKMAE